MTYNDIAVSLERLAQEVDSEIIGYSLLGRPIYAFHLGSYTEPNIIVEGSIHAREYLSGLVVMGQIEYLRSISFYGGMYFVPFVNPDGVALVLDGLSSIPCEKTQKYALLLNNDSDDFSMWKANLNGVDMNVNFDALWGGGSQNVFCPNYQNFVGYYPNSEREVRAIIDFTLRVSPIATLSYHTKGEVIYYGFEILSQEQIERDRIIAQAISAVNGYAVVKTENSTGGYSDWVSKTLGVPAFTVEVGNASLPTPLPLDILEQAILQNREVPLVTLNSTLETLGNITALVFKTSFRQYRQNSNFSTNPR